MSQVTQSAKQQSERATQRIQSHLQLNSRVLVEIAETVLRTLKASNEFVRLQCNSGPTSESVKIATLATDHQLRFSVLTARPTNVHIKKQQWVSPFVDPAIAGWVSRSALDINAPAGVLGLSELATINNIAVEWLVLNAKNARTDRVTFVARDGLDSAPSAMVAGTFVVTSVQSSTSRGGMSITLSNPEQGCCVVLRPEIARLFNSPMSIKGCRVVVHSGGQIRVLRDRAFSSLYKLEQ